jgi:hypothetical protein
VPVPSPAILPSHLENPGSSSELQSQRVEDDFLQAYLRNFPHLQVIDGQLSVPATSRRLRREGRGRGRRSNEATAAAVPVADEPEVQVIDDNVVMIHPALLVQPQDQQAESDSRSRHNWTADEKQLLLNWLSEGLQNYQLWKTQMEKASERVSEVVFQGQRSPSAIHYHEGSLYQGPR